MPAAATTAKACAVECLSRIEAKMTWKMKKKMKGLEAPPVRWTKAKRARKSKVTCHRVNARSRSSVCSVASRTKRRCQRWKTVLYTRMKTETTSSARIGPRISSIQAQMSPTQMIGGTHQRARTNQSERSLSSCRSSRSRSWRIEVCWAVSPPASCSSMRPSPLARRPLRA